MFYIWLGIIILLAIVELLTTELTTIWFVLSGFISLLLTFVTNNFLLQLVVFVVLGVILLISLKSYLQTFLHNKHQERLLNMTGIVIEEITKKKAGIVKLGRKKYMAKSPKKIKVGKPVEILEVTETGLLVSEIQK